MTSVLFTGKYRQRKDWSTNSIPTLVSLEEEESAADNNEFKSVTSKPPRRSSVAIGLLAGRGSSDKLNKRRSSLSATFLGRRDNTKINKETSSNYDTVVKSELSNSFELDTTDLENQENDTNHVTKQNLYESKIKSSDGFIFDKEKRRRSSSWQNKLDRRRKKKFEESNLSVVEVQRKSSTGDIYENDCDEIMFNRQKRHSWWNIFVPDQLKQRSRRASQDVGLMSRSADCIAPPNRRSKSRSVDHGLAAPFDLDTLRSKVEGRFESIDRLSKGDDKKKSLPTIATITYTVGNRDTLTSVAARFDTTPSELSHLNRLNSSFIFPGQLLLVPDKSANKDSTVSDDGEENTSAVLEKSNIIDKKNVTDQPRQEEKDFLEGLRPTSPKPGHIERVTSSKDSSDPADDPVITQRFLKINVRHITDGQGVVGGVLLVTPNAVMFDPNVSDPLVIEHGPESYGVIAPMELVVNAAIFHDIAHMRVSGGESNYCEKVEIYYPKSCRSYESSHSPGKDSLLVKDETFPELGLGSVETCDDQLSVCSSNERDGDAFPKAFERDRVTPTNLMKGETDIASSNKDVIDETKKDTKDSSKEDEKTEDLTKVQPMSSQKPSLEERRKSLLDHHWAIPSKDRSSDDEDDDNETDNDGARGIQTQGPIASVSSVKTSAPDQSNENNSELSKQSCYDSGIDIRDPNVVPLVQPIQTKKVYSDADIVLSSDWVPPRTVSPTHISESPPKEQLAGNVLLQAQSLDTASGRKKTSSVSFSVDDNDQSQSSQSSDKSSDQNKKTKMLKRLSYPLTWVEGLTGEGGRTSESESAPNTGDSNQSVFSKVFSRRSSIGTFMRPHSSEGSHPTTKSNKGQQPKLDYRSMVSIDDMPELFVSFDKLIPRPARACPDPPLYLRLRMGRPIGKAIPLPTSVMSYGKNKLRPEYWFSVPKNRVDELYRFINTWVPHLYGELSEEQLKARGFELIENDTEWTKANLLKGGRQSSDGEDITELTRESWEVLSMSNDDYRSRSMFATGSFDLEFPIPDLIGQTEILTEEHREKLCSHLPARAEGYSWSLVFSTSQHGFSLNSLYRKMQRLESPILIVIEDTEHNVFGALTSCALHVSDHFYGTGESLLYKFNPSFKVFHWTGENLYFIKGNPESLSIGAGDGKFGLWLDGDLNQGRSQQCSTYANEPLSPQEDFVVKTMECWAFV